MQDASSGQQTKQKYKPNHQQTGLPPHSASAIRGKTNKQKKVAQISPYTKLTQNTAPTIVGQKPKGRKKESNLEAWGKETSNTVSLNKNNEMAENTIQMKEQSRNIDVQINEKEIGKLPEKEFRIRIVKRIKNFENKMEKNARIN